MHQRLDHATYTEFLTDPSDAHHLVDLPYLTFARGAAAIADVPAERIINCLPADELVAWAAQHRLRGVM